MARHWKLNAAKDAARVLPRLTVSQTREAVVTHLRMKRSPTRSCARLAGSVPALVDKYVPCVWLCVAVAVIVAMAVWLCGCVAVWLCGCVAMAVWLYRCKTSFACAVT